MTEHCGPPKRVVKKIVKKVVVQPTPTPAERPIRTARLTTRTRPQVTSTRRRPSLPTLDLRRRADVFRDGAVDAAHTVGDGFVSVYYRVLDAIVDAWHWAVGLRLPRLSPLRASAITGLLVGLAAVGLGRGIHQLFSAMLHGTESLGWTFLAMFLLALGAFITGASLLSGFGVPHGRTISILSVLLALLALLVIFLKFVDGVWVLLIVPPLCAAAYATSCALIMLPGAHTNPRRVPWEPTDDTTVT